MTKIVRQITNRTSKGQITKWVSKENGKFYLLKENGCTFVKLYGVETNTIDFITTSNISEVIAYRIGRYLNLPTIPYNLVESKQYPELNIASEYLSKCQLIPYLNNMADLIEHLEGANVFSSLKYIDLAIKGGVNPQIIYQILLFDALIGNEDRHLNNFNINIKSEDKFAIDYILDNGNSLLYNIKPRDIPKLHLERSERIGPDKAKPLSELHDKQVRVITRKLGQNRVIFNIHANIETFMHFLETDPEIQEAFRILNDKIKEQAIKYYLRNRYIKYIDEYVKPTLILLDIKDKQYLVGNCLTNTKQILTESEIFNLLNRKISIDNLKLQTNNNGKQYIQRKKAQITFKSYLCFFKLAKIKKAVYTLTYKITKILVNHLTK